jgi:predicted amidohydrolase
MAASNIDLMLMPHSYCTPTQPTKTTSQADIDRLNSLPGRVARLYNEWFGVPVLMCNKSGGWDSPVPDSMLGIPKGFRFSGRSILLDADRTLRGELGDEEAVLVGTVTLAPGLNKQAQPPKYSRYIYPGSPGREILRLMEWRGSLSYTFSKLRKNKAALYSSSGENLVP